MLSIYWKVAVLQEASWFALCCVCFEMLMLLFSPAATGLSDLLRSRDEGFSASPVTGEGQMRTVVVNRLPGTEAP